RGEGKPAEARRLLEEAVRHQEAAVKGDPKRRGFRAILRDHYAALAATLAGLGEHAEAARVAEELPRAAPGDRTALFDAACALALCTPVAEKDAQLPPEKRKDLARSYADRAMESLRQAVESGFNNVRQLRQDPALEPLRSRRDFQELVKGLEAKGG